LPRVTFCGRSLQAPEPETLKWAHLEFGPRSIFFRGMLLYLLSLAGLALGLFLITEANIVKESLACVCK
jgi:hypothetical protein